MDRLRKVVFSAEHQKRFSDFDFGEETYAKEVADYVLADVDSGGALTDIAKGRCVAWAYANEGGELVGFAALGSTKNWPWPNVAGPRIVANHVVFCGIGRRFRGQPPGPPEERYSSQLIDDLIAESRAKVGNGIEPLVTLFVHPENGGAIKLYERAGFLQYEHFYHDKKADVRYLGMHLRL